MRVYVMRHGHALNAAEAGVDSDADRPLSEKGRRDAAGMARHLAGLGAAPAAILSSPLRRAMETAAQAEPVLKPRMGVLAFAPLENVINGAGLADELAAWSGKEPGAAEVMLVGHMPQLGELVAALTGQAVEFRPASVAAVEVGPGKRAVLLWSRDP